MYSVANMEEAAARVLIAVPKPPAPPTGDALGTWFIFAGFTAVVFVVLIIINRRAKKKDRQ